MVKKKKKRKKKLKAKKPKPNITLRHRSIVITENYTCKLTDMKQEKQADHESVPAFCMGFTLLLFFLGLGIEGLVEWLD